MRGLLRVVCVSCVTAARMTTSGTSGWLWKESGQRSCSTAAVRTQGGRTKSSESWANMCLNTSQSRVESRLESRLDRQDFYKGMSGLSVSYSGGMKNHLGEKVKVNSRSAYRARVGSNR